MTKPQPGQRVPLSRDRILAAAVKVADIEGLDAITMRRLGQELGVEAMSLYKHIENKDAILDGMVDLVLTNVYQPEPGGRWQTELRAYAGSARTAFGAHPWAIGLMNAREKPSQEYLARLDRCIGVLREGGFSLEAAAHALSFLDSYIYGSAVQEASLPFDSPEGLAEVTENILEQMPIDELPYLAEMGAAFVLDTGYDQAAEFEFGLELVLDTLDGLADARP